jgi:hypothetical protein
MMNLSTDQISTKPNPLQHLYRLKTDEEYYFPRVLKIITKKKKLVPFVFNPMQLKVKAIIDKQEAETGMIRAIILKARQHGVSTYVQGKYYHRCSMNRYRKALIVSHELDSAEHIMGMSRIFLQESPLELVPMTRRSNRREILFENPDFDPRKKNNPGLRSHLRIDTANDVDIGASMTLTDLHLSEVARWANASQTLTSLLQAIPDEPGTSVIFESTAMGVGGEFHRRYMEAKAGLSGYVAIFIAWFENPEYAFPIRPGEIFDWDDDELKLQKKFSLSDEQLKWRRITIRDKCNGKLTTFQQEYPSTDEEAFLTSGSKKYELEIIERAAKHVIPPIAIGELVFDPEKNEALFHNNRRGMLQIWEFPVPGRAYVIAADVCEGVSDGDNSCATVWDHNRWEQVAMLRGKCSPEDFGGLLYDLGKFFGGGLVAPESNSIGLTSCVILKNLGYPNIYYTRKKDEKTNERTRKIGFLTTSRTRSIGIGLLGKAMKEDDIIIRAQEIIDEVKTFVVKEGGKVEADQGCHDDCVISTVIFVSVATELPAPDFEAEKMKTRVLYRGGSASWRSRR